MDTGGYLLVALIAIPALSSAMVVLSGKEGYIRIVVLATSFLCIVLSAGFLLFMSSEGAPVWFVDRSELGDPDLLIFALDIVIAVVIGYIGYSRRNLSIVFLAFMTLVASMYIELFAKEEAVGAALVADYLAIVMLLITNIVGAIICIYALGYMSGDPRQSRFFAFMLLFLSGMSGAVLCNDLLWLFMFWEVTTICSYMLIAHDGTPKAYVSAERALTYTLVGALAFSFSMILLAEDFPTLELSAIDPAAMTDVVVVALPLLVIAAIAKSAQLPFQSWLVGAMVAPTPVSALLHSATMVNLGAYLVLRLWHFWDHFDYLGWGVVAIGSLTFLSTSILALRQSNSKRVLAYSTIGNLGLIFVCAGIATEVSVAAGILLLLFHAIAKALLFLSVGVVKHETGSEDIEDMQELRQRMPLAAFSLYAGVFLMLLPPFGLFIAKWMMSEAAIDIPAAALIVAIGFGATTAYYGKWLGRMYMAPSGSTRSSLKGAKMGRLFAYPIILLIGIGMVLSTVISLVVTELVDPFVPSGVDVDVWGILTTGTGSLPLFVLLIAMGVCFVLFSLYLAPRKEETDEEYSCGEPFETVVTGTYLFDERTERWAIVLSESAAMALVIYLLISPYLDVEVAL